MKVFFQIVAWLGALIIALAVSIAYDVGGFNVDLYGFGLMVAAFFCLVGVFLLLLGGFYFPGSFSVGCNFIGGYSLSCHTSTSVDAHAKIGGNVGWLDWRLSLISVFPGLTCVVGGVFMRWQVLKYRHNPIQTSEDK